jgi:ribonuclease I
MKIPMFRAALAAGLFVAVSCGSVGRATAGHCDPGPVQGAPGEFDFYLMALSVAPTFCETQGRRTNNAPLPPMPPIGRSR